MIGSKRWRKQSWRRGRGPYSLRGELKFSIKKIKDILIVRCAVMQKTFRMERHIGNWLEKKYGIMSCDRRRKDYERNKCYSH